MDPTCFEIVHHGRYTSGVIDIRVRNNQSVNAADPAVPEIAADDGLADIERTASVFSRNLPESAGIDQPDPLVWKRDDGGISLSYVEKGEYEQRRPLRPRIIAVAGKQASYKWY